MARRPETETYFYQGSALALGGSFEKPVCASIPSQASAVLSSTGGYGVSRVENYRFEEIVSFQSAYAETIGNYDSRQKTFSTLSTAVIRGFDLLGMVTADAIVARVSAECTLTASDSKYVVTLEGSHFVNLRIAGRRQKVELLPSGLGDAAVLQLSSKPGRRQTLFGSAGEDCEVQPIAPIEIPQFGTVYIGELLPSPFAPRLTMLRVSLGCAVQGTVTGGSAEGGGREWP